MAVAVAVSGAESKSESGDLPLLIYDECPRCGTRQDVPSDPHGAWIFCGWCQSTSWVVRVHAPPDYGPYSIQTETETETETTTT